MTNFLKKISKLKIDHGFDKESTHRPLIDDAAIEEINKHVKDAVEKGAKGNIGNKQIGDHFFEPTLLNGMTNNMVITTDETLGPIAALYSFEEKKKTSSRELMIHRSVLLAASILVILVECGV